MWLFFIVSISGFSVNEPEIHEIVSRDQCVASIKAAGTKFFSAWCVGPSGEIVLQQDVAGAQE